MRNIKSYIQKIHEARLLEANAFGIPDDERQRALDDELLLAARTGNLGKTKELLELGASVNATDKNNDTALHLATMQDFPEIMKILIEAGARVNVYNKYRKMPIHYAIEWASLDSMKILLDAGAETEAVNKEGKTPIMIVGSMLLPQQSNDKKEAIKLLITRGADLFKRFSSPQELIEFFDGDISWMQEPLRSKLLRMHRGKSAFGM